MTIEFVRVIKTIEIDDAEVTKEEFDEIIDFAEKNDVEIRTRIKTSIDMRPPVVV